MKTPSRILFASLLFSVANVTAEEKQAAIILPAEFELTSLPVADAENGIVLFVKEFKVPVGEEMERYGDSLELLKAGKPVADPRFLDEFRQTHELGKMWLKPPLRFLGYETPTSHFTALIKLFQATEILARQALLEGDRKSSDHYLADAIFWSQLLRKAQPTLVAANLSEYGWRSTIGLHFKDWQDHDNQRKRLDELLKIFQVNRIEVEEVVGIAKAEARWWAAQGGTRAFLKKSDQDNVARLLLNDRFKDLTLAELLSLPYDREADFKRYFNEVSGQIQGLRQGIPALNWPGVSNPVVNRTIDDYRKLPNGLGDLMFEQGKNFWGGPPWINGLRRQRLLDACLLWLKRERNGLDVTADTFKEITNPISGRALDIDLDRRVIRCRGWDGKAAPVNTNKLNPGFHDEQDDFLLVVPRWKERK